MPAIPWDEHRAAYAACMFAAAVVFLLVRWLQPAQPLRAVPRRSRYLLLGAAFVGGVFGARAPFIVQSAPWALDAWIADGKTLTTGIIGAYLMVELAKWLLGVRVKTGDGFALPLAAGLAVGRWGCFLNGCCYGKPTALPWGVDFLGDGPRHPTQIYEVAFHAALALVLCELARRNVLRTQWLKLYLIAYFLFRFATEYLRPAPAWLYGLTFYQVASILMIGFLTWQWRRDARPIEVPSPPHDSAVSEDAGRADRSSDAGAIPPSPSTRTPSNPVF